MVADGTALDDHFIVRVTVYPQTNCRQCGWIQTGPQKDGKISKCIQNQQKMKANREASLESSSQKVGRN